MSTWKGRCFLRPEEPPVLLPHTSDGPKTAIVSIAKDDERFAIARSPGETIKEAWSKWSPH
jgi:hypothetical protein